MEHRKINQPRPEKDAEQTFTERRFAPAGFEFREGPDGSAPRLFGYALRFGSTYDMGWFTEEVQRGALDKADMADIRILLNHDPNNILGRTAAGTAKVGVDDIGMWYEVELPTSPNGENARVAVLRGDITQSSWGFALRKDETGRRIGDKWEIRNGKEHRILTDVATVFDASPVTFPANPDTTVAKRSRDEAMPERRDGDMGDMPGEGADNQAPSWKIAWMVDTVASVAKESNETIQYLNYWAESYKYYVEDGSDKSPIFQTLIDGCQAAKDALVSLIDIHADALKALNASDNRSAKDTAPEEAREEEQKQETKTNTVSESLSMELELAKAKARAQNSKL